MFFLKVQFRHAQNRIKIDLSLGREMTKVGKQIN
jgi:hypothetical protein